MNRQFSSHQETTDVGLRHNNNIFRRLEGHTCQRCGDIFSNFKNLVKHVRLKHALEKNFSVRCEISQCNRTYHNIQSYRRHLYRRHRERMIKDDSSETDHEENCLVNGPDNNELEKEHNTLEETSCVSAGDIYNQMSMLLMKMKEQYHTPDVALNEVGDQLVSLLENSSVLHNHEISQQLNLDVDKISSVEHCLDYENLRNVFCNTRNREQYWLSNCNVIMPVEVLHGQAESGQTLCSYMIPVDQVIIGFLKHSDIWSEVTKPVTLSETHFHDIFDGAFLKNIYEENTVYLQLYADEFEICNPIGSKRGNHKLLAVYFSILNLNFRYRSKLDTIHLAMLVKQSVVKKFGINSVLEPLYRNLQHLEKHGLTVNGIKFNVSVPIFCGDNLGIHTLAGFSQCFSSSRICRFCMGSKISININFEESSFVLRTAEVHEAHLNAISENPTLCTTYGVNYKCIFDDLKHFSVTSSLPPDIMHDVLEGVIQLLFLQILPKILGNNEMLNTRMTSFSYHHSDKSAKPSPMSKWKIKGTASQKWCIFRLLPLFIGDYILPGNKYWELYLLFREIVDLIFAPVIPKRYISYLGVCINYFLNMFKDLFPDCAVTPKMHYLIHYPRLIEHFGPLVRVWTMRFESLHSYFKRSANTTACYKNIAYTLAKRYQILKAYQLNSSSLILFAPITSGSVEVERDSVSTSVIEHLQESYKRALPNHFSSCLSVTLDCTEYRRDCMYCFKFEAGLPQFIFAEKIFLINGTVILYGYYFTSTHFDHHFHVFVVKRIGTISVKAESLIDFHQLPLYRISEKYMVVMKYSLFDE